MTCPNCPRRCSERPGYCQADSRHPEVAAVYPHRGEEPPLSGNKGISNVFFAHCNLQCIYCQNHEISRAAVSPELVKYRSLEAIIDGAIESLQHTENMLGLVSATQYADVIPALIDGLHQRGCYPTVVYNSNGYERVEVLQQLAPYVDIYLPDFKYADAALGQRYSHVSDYPEVAGRALKEMLDQKGTSLPIDDSGLAFRGIIVRHLVLPGQVQNSIDSLRWIADNLSTNLHISLMAQYNPPEVSSLPDALNRRLQAEEYQEVVDAFYALGFHRGWVQQLEAADSYNPHFKDKEIFRNR